MSNYVRSAAYAAAQALTARGLTVKRSHLSEVIAALLGYRTYAALVVEDANPKLDYHLDDAEIVVLNLPSGAERVAELGLEAGAASVVISACVAALKASVDGVSVYDGVPDFYDSHAREALAEAIYNSDEVADAMAESNAAYPNEPEMDLECPLTEDLWAATDEWTIQANGDMAGQYDPDGDRMFTGDTLNCCGWLSYRKAGRAGLVFVEAGGSGGADDSWRDRDRDDELAYQQSLNPTTNLSHDPNNKLVLDKITHFETRCDELMSLLSDKRQASSDELEHVKGVYLALKNDLKAAAKYGTVSGKPQELTEAERYFYKPTVQKAALALRPATNSDPIKSDWFSAVYDAHIDLSDCRHNMQHGTI